MNGTAFCARALAIALFVQLAPCLFAQQLFDPTKAWRFETVSSVTYNPDKLTHVGLYVNSGISEIVPRGQVWSVTSGNHQDFAFVSGPVNPPRPLRDRTTPVLETYVVRLKSGSTVRLSFEAHDNTLWCTYERTEGDVAGQWDISASDVRFIATVAPIPPG